MLEADRRLRVLDRLAETLYTMVDEYFDSDSRLRYYVAKRVSGAREILASPKRLRRVRRVGPKTVRAMFASSLAEDARPERRLLLKTLDGGVVEVSVGTPVEQLLHFTEVSPSMLRCSCQDSLFTASAADAEAARAGLRVPVFHRYSLCKHVLALLAHAIAEGVLHLEDPVLRRSLRLGLLAAYVRLYRGTPRAIEALRRFGKNLEPLPAVVN